MSQRAKTTPASTAGSWAPHAGARSRVEAAHDPAATAGTFDAIVAEHCTSDDAARWLALADQIGRTNAARRFDDYNGDVDLAESVSSYPNMHGHEEPAATDEALDEHIRRNGLTVQSLTTQPLECDHVAILAARMWDDVSTYGPGYNRGAVEALTDARRAAERGDRIAATLHLAAAQVAVGERTVDSRLRLENRIRFGLNRDAFEAAPTEQLRAFIAQHRERETTGGFDRDWTPAMTAWPEPDGRAGASVSYERLLLETIIEERRRT